MIKYTKELLEPLVANSMSIAQVLQQLPLKAKAGGNYRTVRQAIDKFNLDTSHFTGQGWNKGKKFTPKRPLTDYLGNQIFIGSHKLRRRLITEGLLKAICSKCNLTTWLSKDIPLELHHKDGNYKNNSLSNLCLLCPNCHALESNHRGRAKQKSI